MLFKNEFDAQKAIKMNRLQIIFIFSTNRKSIRNGRNIQVICRKIISDEYQPMKRVEQILQLKK